MLSDNEQWRALEAFRKDYEFGPGTPGYATIRKMYLLGWERALQAPQGPREEFTERTADRFKAAGYDPQVIWFNDQGGEWQLWLYPQKAIAFSRHFSGPSIESVVQQGLEWIPAPPQSDSP